MSTQNTCLATNQIRNNNETLEQLEHCVLFQHFLMTQVSHKQGYKQAQGSHKFPFRVSHRHLLPSPPTSISRSIYDHRSHNGTKWCGRGSGVKHKHYSWLYFFLVSECEWQSKRKVLSVSLARGGFPKGCGTATSDNCKNSECSCALLAATAVSTSGFDHHADGGAESDRANRAMETASQGNHYRV